MAEWGDLPNTLKNLADFPYWLSVLFRPSRMILITFYFLHHSIYLSGLGFPFQSVQPDSVNDSVQLEIRIIIQDERKSLFDFPDCFSRFGRPSRPALSNLPTFSLISIAFYTIQSIFVSLVVISKWLTACDFRNLNNLPDELESLFDFPDCLADLDDLPDWLLGSFLTFHIDDTDYLL